GNSYSEAKYRPTPEGIRTSPDTPRLIFGAWAFGGRRLFKEIRLTSRHLVRHDDRAGGGEHAADAVADRDPGAGDLRRSYAAHLAHALLQCVHAVHAGMHVGEAAAIGVERQFAAGGGVMLGDEGAGLAARHEAEILEAVDRQVRER